MVNNRRYTNNQDSDDYIFEDEPGYAGQYGETDPGQDAEQYGERDIEEIAVTLEDESAQEPEGNRRAGGKRSADSGDTRTAESGDTQAAESGDTQAAEREPAEVDYAKLYGDEGPKKPGGAKRIAAVAAAVVFLVAALAAAGIIIHKFTPSKARVDYNQYFEKYGRDGEILIYNYQVSDYGVRLKDGHFYVENDFLKEFFTDKFFYDEKNNAVLYTTATEIYTIPVGAAYYTVDGERRESSCAVALAEDGKVYISVEFAAERCDMQYRGYEGPDRLVIVDGGSKYTRTVMKDEYTVRDKADIKGSIIEDASDAADTLWMLDAAEGAESDREWLAVRSEDGRSGFVRASHTAGIEEYTYAAGAEEPVYPSQLRDHDILLVWHAVYGLEDNARIGELLADAKGVNTVSPTWYKVINAEGDISSMADRDYVDYIHGLGMEIWPLISDFTSVDSDGGWDEKALLSDTGSRRRLIENIMSEINGYGYDGINIDFEKVPKDAGEGYIQFIRELSISCRKAGVVLSVDNYVPKPYNMQYNRTAQGECADYVIVMGYDEHYSGGSEAGSVASIGFVSEGITETLKEVPEEKVINGIPFYTRLWIEGEDEDGNLALTSKSYGMDGGAAIAEELGLTKVWDDGVKQYVATGTADGKSYSIWLEDESSMKARMEVIRNCGIAGVAAWCLGMESDSVWDIIAGE